MFACRVGLRARLHALADEGRVSYGCVLVVGATRGALDAAIERLETERALTPFVTGWCPRCRRSEVLTSMLSEFPDATAFLAHIVARARVDEPGI